MTYTDRIVRDPAVCGAQPIVRGTADGQRGLNFLTPEIAAYARARQKEFPAGIKAHRLFCNMLSSQPMCFNLVEASCR